MSQDLISVPGSVVWLGDHGRLMMAPQDLKNGKIDFAAECEVDFDLIEKAGNPSLAAKLRKIEADLKEGE